MRRDTTPFPSFSCVSKPLHLFGGRRTRLPGAVFDAAKTHIRPSSLSPSFPAIFFHPHSPWSFARGRFAWWDARRTCRWNRRHERSETPGEMDPLFGGRRKRIDRTLDGSIRNGFPIDRKKERKANERTRRDPRRNEREDRRKGIEHPFPLRGDVSRFVANRGSSGWNRGSARSTVEGPWPTTLGATVAMSRRPSSMHITPHQGTTGWMQGNRRPPPCHHPSIDPRVSHANEAGSDPRNPPSDADRRIGPSFPVPVPTHGKMVQVLTSQPQITMAHRKRTVAIEGIGDADPPGVAERVRARILPDACIRPEDHPDETAHPAGCLHRVGCKNHPNLRPFHPPGPSARGAPPLVRASIQGLRLRPRGVGTKRNVPSPFLSGGTSSVRPSASVAAGVASVRVQFRPPAMPPTPRRLRPPPRAGEPRRLALFHVATSKPPASTPGPGGQSGDPSGRPVGVGLDRGTGDEDGVCRPHPHRKMAEAQVSPAPNPATATVSPWRIFPCRTASSRARGMDAAEVLP